MKEVWKDIPGYEGRYQASSLGRIRSVDRIVKQKTANGRICDRFLRGTILKPTKFNYQFVHLGRCTGRKKVHHLVLLTFIGPKPFQKACGAHLNGIRHDNRASNLTWCSNKENHSHKLAHGTLIFGEQHHAAKLTDKKINIIRKEYRQGVRGFGFTSLSQKYKMSYTSLRDVIIRKTWKHI